MDDFKTLSFSVSEQSMEVSLGAGSRFFADHFPDRPLLPAIAHLVLVDDLVRRCLGERAEVVAVERARWNRPVSPGARLRVRLSSARIPTQLRFEVEEGGARVCDGLLTWRAREAE